MNREEREEYVIELYKEGRTVRQIAELVQQLLVCLIRSGRRAPTSEVSSGLD
jgi:hypothetical protein